MATLIADRFLCRSVTVGLDFPRATRALDLATGARVLVRINEAGARPEQQAWTEACVRAHATGMLIDFGLIGASLRFEARTAAGERKRQTTGLDSPALAGWLEHARPASPRVLTVDALPDARVVRQRGFVPCHVALLEDADLRADLADAIRGRSVALLAPSVSPEAIALALLRLPALEVRDFCAIVQFRHTKGCHAMKAAESRATYGAPVVIEPRVAKLNHEIERLVMRGRHAAAERTLGATVAALDRRADHVRAGDVELTRGRLLLTRGRAADAKVAFAGAHERFQRARAEVRALEATVYLGLAQTDLGLLNDAEHTCRAAHSAVTALGAPDRMLFSAIALARVLLWQQRYADARSILETVSAVGDVEQCARYWCLASRLRLAVDAVPDARRAIEQARPPASSISPAIEAVVRAGEAAIQATLGDVDALRVHVARGLAAARAARMPLQAISLRVTLVEGLVKAERFGQARSAVRHLARLRGGAVPPLLKSRIEKVLSGLTRTPSVREATARFHVTSGATDFHDLETLRELLATSHHVEDEMDALARAAAAIRRHTDAAGVAIYGSQGSTSRLLGGSGCAGEATARRAMEIGQPIRPEMSGIWIEAAVPIHYLGRITGAVAVRWSIDGPGNAERALAFGAAAAAVCAPLVYVLMDRHAGAVHQEGDFDLLGTSRAIADVRQAIARAANAPFTVLVEGESGSGKELVARAIHRAGCRRDRRFAAFNCAAMPEDLVDAELFGHAKGAFTGAATERLGLFESADGGTVFLDEVGELSARAQAKVLRVLQEGEVRRIGEHFTRPFDARLVAATNRSLGAEADAGRFRRDLLYRLDVIRINVPPLRDRAEDIPLLAARFWRQAADRIGSKAALGHGALCALARYDWPGNVRELQNVLTALVVAVPARGIARASDLPAAIARAAQVPAHESLESARLKFEERFVRAALARSAGHRGQAAAALGLSRQGLAKVMQRLHLDR